MPKFNEIRTLRDGQNIRYGSQGSWRCMKCAATVNPRWVKCHCCKEMAPMMPFIRAICDGPTLTFGPIGSADEGDNQ